MHKKVSQPRSYYEIMTPGIRESSSWGCYRILSIIGIILAAVVTHMIIHDYMAMRSFNARKKSVDLHEMAELLRFDLFAVAYSSAPMPRFHFIRQAANLDSSAPPSLSKQQNTIGGVSVFRPKEVNSSLMLEIASMRRPAVIDSISVAGWAAVQDWDLWDLAANNWKFLDNVMCLQPRLPRRKERGVNDQYAPSNKNDRTIDHSNTFLFDISDGSRGRDSEASQGPWSVSGPGARMLKGEDISSFAAKSRTGRLDAKGAPAVLSEELPLVASAGPMYFLDFLSDTRNGSAAAQARRCVYSANFQIMERIAKVSSARAVRDFDVPLWVGLGNLLHVLPCCFALFCVLGSARISDIRWSFIS